MTIWKKPAEPASQAPDADIDDLIASLDAELGKAPAKRSAPKAAPKKAPEPPAFVQMWFPKGIVSHALWQECACGQVHTSFTGLFLEEQHKFGATRQTRHNPKIAIPHEYSTLDVRVLYTEEQIDACHECQAFFYAAAPEPKRELVRSLPHDPTEERPEDTELQADTELPLDLPSFSEEN